MTKIAYLLGLTDTNPAEIRDTWAALGSLVVTDATKLYIRDSIFKVDCGSGELNGAIVYCIAPYTVTSDDTIVDWENLTIQGVEGKVSAYQGVTTPYFRVLLTASQVAAITAAVNTSLIPFSGINTQTEVKIDDEQLGILLNETGVPFLTVDELEITRDSICTYCIKPALDQYFTFFPIVQEEAIGNFGGGAAFKVPYPDGAYHGILYYTIGAYGGDSSYGNGAFALYREQLAYGGTNGVGFGNGLSYRKPVPGFVGLNNRDAMLQTLQAQQGYLNYFRREHYTKTKIDGKYYAVGYTTIGGYLNAKWFKSSYNWEDIDFSLLGDVRNLAKAYIMRNLGMLRAMVKSDLPGNIDFSLYNTRADSLEQKVIDKWEKSATNYSFSAMRGGL
jgi:hypothetical protein